MPDIDRETWPCPGGHTWLCTVIDIDADHIREWCGRWPVPHYALCKKRHGEASTSYCFYPDSLTKMLPIKGDARDDRLIRDIRAMGEDERYKIERWVLRLNADEFHKFAAHWEYNNGTRYASWAMMYHAVKSQTQKVVYTGRIKELEAELRLPLFERNNWQEGDPPWNTLVYVKRDNAVFTARRSTVDIGGNGHDSRNIPIWRLDLPHTNVAYTCRYFDTDKWLPINSKE